MGRKGKRIEMRLGWKRKMKLVTCSAMVGFGDFAEVERVCLAALVENPLTRV